MKCYSSALHLLARLQRTRSFWRLPYEDLGPKALMKASFQRTFGPKSSQGGTVTMKLVPISEVLYRLVGILFCKNWKKLGEK